MVQIDEEPGSIRVAYYSTSPRYLSDTRVTRREVHVGDILGHFQLVLGCKCVPVCACFYTRD